MGSHAGATRLRVCMWPAGDFWRRLGVRLPFPLCGRVRVPVGCCRTLLSMVPCFDALVCRACLRCLCALQGFGFITPDGGAADGTTLVFLFLMLHPSRCLHASSVQVAVQTQCFDCWGP